MTENRFLQSDREIIGEDNRFVSGFAALCGIKAELVEADHAVFSLEYRPELANRYGVFHGGVLVTLADQATGGATHTDGRKYVTLSNDFHFLENVDGGTVTAEAVVLRRGQTTCVTEVKLKAENGQLLASGAFTFYCIPQA